jgi:hypothetical protein
MKKIIILITIFVSSVLAINAQVTAEPALRGNDRYRSAVMNEWDIVTMTNTISKYFTWDIAYGVKYKINVSADSSFTSDWDNDDYACFILKEGTNGVFFTNIDTIEWYGTSEDTSFMFDRTGSVTTLLSQSLTLADSSAEFSLTESASGWNYVRYVGVEAKVDSAGGNFLWTDCDITIWLEK